MKKLFTFILIYLFTLSNLFSQSVELKTQNGYCVDSNYLYLNDTNGMSKNWEKIEWYNSNNLIKTNIKTSSKTAEIVVGVPTNIGQSSNSFFYPESMYRDSEGVIYVVDYGNQRVQKWLPGATSGITVAGGNGRGSAMNQLNEPQGIFVDNLGNVYVADKFNNRIQKWAVGSNTGVTVANTSAPHSVFLDKKGNIYTDSFSSIIKFTDGSNTGVKVAGGSNGSAGNQFGGFIPFIYVDDNDNLYVSDNGNHRIQKFAPGETNGVTIAGGNGLGSAQNQLFYPFGFFFDADKNLYIADSWNQRIQKWAPGANTGSTVAGGNGEGFEQNKFQFPQSVFLGNNDLFILDRNNCRVQKWTIGSLMGSTIAGSANGTGRGSSDFLLNNPTNLAKDSKGNLYVTDLKNNRVQKFAPGDKKGVTLSFVTWPNDVKVDRNDNVYVSSEGCQCVLKFIPDSTQGIVVAGGNGQGSNSNQFFNPYGIFIDKFDNLYVCDINNQRVQKWAPGATSGITVAGGNGFGGASNQFNGPNSLSVDDDLNLYVVDRFNSRIQKWAPGATSGITVAGGNGEGSGANQFYNPRAIFLTPNGDIFVSDSQSYGYGNTQNQRIQKWIKGSKTGITIFGGNGLGTQLNQLNDPFGILIDKNNFLYIVDEGNHRILKVDQNQIIDTTFKELTSGIFKAKVYDNLGNVSISNEIKLNANPVIPAQTISACNGIPFNFSPENVSTTTIIPEGTTYTWTVASNPYITGEANSTVAGKSSISQTLVNTTTSSQTIIYTVIPTSGLGCQGTPFTLNVILSALTQAPSADLIQTLDDGATLSNIAITGTAIKWYNTPSGGTPLNVTFTLVNGGIYYASQTLNSCESQSRLMVTVKLNPFTLPNNNFAIETKSETCATKNNGQIIITTSQTNNYFTTINGKNYNFVNNGLTVSDLAPGVYTFCIGVTGKTFEQCYSVTIGKGGSITGKSSVSSNKALVEITSGTAPFEIVVNGTSQFETSENNFSVDVKQGDLLEIKTSVACEGIYSTNILDRLIGVIIHPNPTAGLFEITIHTSKTEVEIELYSISSQLISKRKYPVINQRVQLSLEKEPNGIYFAKLNLDSPLSLTIIKKS